MLFLKRKNIDKAAPKRRSLLFKAINPELGKSIRPLVQTTSVFVQLIAIVFAMNGLFPKDHPGLTGGPDGPVRLKASDVIRTAWNGLSFTPAGAPKVILFVAVTATIVLAVLSLVTALLMGFVGTAHAQSSSGGVGSSTFFASAGTDDLAQNALDYIFKATAISPNYAQNGLPIPATVNIQCAMQTALGFYSNAMLMFAAIILFYHLATMIVNTAHHGVVMGKQANQIWAPIRLVVAVGLLVPIGSGPTACQTGGKSGAGMNSGQYIVVKMAELGSGMASQTWKTFINALAGLKYNYVQPATPFVEETVGKIVSMEACRFAWNYQICAKDNPGVDVHSICANPNPPDYIASTPALRNEQIMDPTVPPAQYTDPSSGNTTYRYTTANNPSGADICGSFTVPGLIILSPNAATKNPLGNTLGRTFTTEQTAVAISQAQQQTITQLLPQFATVGAYIKYQIPQLNDGNPPDNTDYTKLVVDYQNKLKHNLDAAFANVTSPQLQTAKIASLGWAAAGAWLNTLARDQGAIVNAYQDGLPQRIIPPNMDKLNGGETPGPAVSKPLSAFQSWLNNGSSTRTDYTRVSSTAAGTINCYVQAAPTTKAPPQFTAGSLDDKYDAVHAGNVKFLVQGLLNDIGDHAQGETVLKQMLIMVETLASNAGVWSPLNADACSANSPAKDHFTLGAQLVTANPLAELSFWGYANLTAGYKLFESIVDFTVKGAIWNADLAIQQTRSGVNFDQEGLAKTAKQGLDVRAYGFINTILGTAATIFLTIGYSLAFVLPLFPFFRFFFAVITWIVSVLEAVTAVPLIALAHLNPEGEGLPGGTAKAAYFMVFNVFLRPVMTIFGLIAGLLVFYVAIIFLNATYAIAVDGTQAMYHTGVATLTRLAYTFIYAATAYTCANTCFKTIDMFPDQALRWISANAHSEKMGDENQNVKAVMGQLQSYGGDKAVSIIQRGGQ
jgi:conjugal transfer/type IV secretion protein DotA/TraY